MNNPPPADSIGNKTPKISIAKYRELKEKLKSAEAENTNKIFLIPCSGNKGWYELAENSALIYYYRICETLKIKVNFEPDHDSYYSPYELGRIRTRNPEIVKKRLIAAKYYQSHRIKNFCHIFTLNVKLEPSTIDNLRAKELNRRSQNQQIIKPTFSDPVLYCNLLEASKRLHQACATKLDKLSSQTNGTRLVSLIDDIIIEYYKITNSKDPTIWQSLLEKTDLILYEVQLLSEIKFWNHETSLSVSKVILQIKNQLERLKNENS